MVISGNSFGLRGIKLEHNKNNVTPPGANKWRAAHPVVILKKFVLTQTAIHDRIIRHSLASPHRIAAA
jgi:hypothetical protein